MFKILNKFLNVFGLHLTTKKKEETVKCLISTLQEEIDEIKNIEIVKKVKRKMGVV